jgi:tight adherence protein C
MIQTLTNPDNILAAFIALVVFATMVTLVMPMVGQTSLEGRLKSVANRREELRRRSREAMNRDAAAGSGLRHTDQGLYKKVVERLQLSRLLEDPKVVEKLAQAGFRGPKPVTTFYFFRLVAPILIGIVTATYIYLVNDFGLAAMLVM